MDLDGLEKLLNQQHNEVIRRLDNIDNRFTSQQAFCDGRFDVLEGDVKKHDRCLSKSKGIITAIGAIWAAVTGLIALMAPYFWR